MAFLGQAGCTVAGICGFGRKAVRIDSVAARGVGFRSTAALCRTESMARDIGRLADEAVRTLGGLRLSDRSLDLLLEEGRRSGVVGVS